MSLNTEKSSFWTILDIVIKYRVALIFAFVGFITLNTDLNKPTIKSRDNLKMLSGTFTYSSFTIEQGHRNQLYKYYFWLEEFGNAFQIKADFKGLFNETEFKRKIKKGDLINLTIANELTKKLDNPEEFLFIMSLNSPKGSYLSLNDTLKKEEGNSGYFISIIFLILAILAFFFIYTGLSLKVKKLYS